MKTSFAVLSLAATLAVPQAAVRELQTEALPRESRIPAGPASLYARDIGRGQPIVVLHGGPDFDHA